MNHPKTAFIVFLLAFGSRVNGQALDSEALVRRAISASSQVSAAKAVIASKQAELKAAQASTPSFLELAPGVGYTNGSLALSREFDIFGRRSARESLAKGDLSRAQVSLIQAESEAAAEALSAASRLLRAQAFHQAAQESRLAGEALLESAAKLHSIGEAPKSHVSRAELEALRARQALALAESELRAASSAMNHLLGSPRPEIEQPVIWTSLPDASLKQPANSVELLAAKAEHEQALNRVRSVRSDFQPTLTAGITSNAWRLDKARWSGEDWGLQAVIRFPLHDRKQTRQTISAAEEAAKSSESLIRDASWRADGRRKEAISALEAARRVVQVYKGEIVPKAVSLVEDLRKGYQAGLVTLLEVLEAQEALAEMKRESAEAESSIRSAEISLMKAVLALPGLEVKK